MITLRVLSLVSAAAFVAACSSVSTPSPVPDAPPYTPVTVNPYPNGYLPTGDGMYTSNGPEDGLVYTCSDFGDSLGNNGIGGAVQRGSWFSEDGKSWNPSLKPHVRGDVPVPGRFHMDVRDGLRIIGTNSLPESHGIGQFPVAEDDPVRAIDPNPNTPSVHDRVYVLPAQPLVSSTPGCVGHQVGVMLRGGPLYSPLDAEGRDAVAWEVQDRCDGHPEPDGTYHYHGPSPCLPGMETNQIVGFAMDGFPITGNRDSNGRTLYSRDLDVCHGRVTELMIDGKGVTTYAYAMTEDYPYTVACFKAGEVEREVA